MGVSAVPHVKGMWYDGGITNLYKTQTRSYAPDLGRFTQDDPARAGTNWYAYAGGDPVNRSDPSGLDWVWNDEDSAWKWVANATNPNKGEQQDIPIPEWAVPGYNWRPGLAKTISTEHALVTRLAKMDDMGSPAIIAMAQLVGSGLAGYSTQGGAWNDETVTTLFQYFKDNKIGSGTAGIDSYNKYAGAEQARIEALVEAQRHANPKFDAARFREGMYKSAKIGLGMIPVVSALDATVKAQSGDSAGAAESAAGAIPFGTIIKIGGVAVAGTIVQYMVKPTKALKELDIDAYAKFGIPERIGDKLAGHEVLQNAWLMLNHYVQKRGVGAVSRENPALAVGDALHKKIGALQREMGLFNQEGLRQITARENIMLNAIVLKRAGVPDEVVKDMIKEAMKHAQSLP